MQKNIYIYIKMAQLSTSYKQTKTHTLINNYDGSCDFAVA